MGYRREIDGLRSIAVLPVILFHAGFSVFSGGYVGVDIFFVISGYLITNNIVSQMESGNFSIIDFYERRVKRILPALFFVVLCTIPFTYVLFLPLSFIDFSESLMHLIFFSTNFLFWMESGYFSPNSELKPLLHTWSLAVEEQFYLFFPILILFVWRFGKVKTVYLIALILAASLAISEIGSRTAISANFYLAPSRAWELLAGSLCSFAVISGKNFRDNILAGLGLALIVFSILHYDSRVPFPSLYTAVPVGGSCLIILFARKETIVGKLLSFRLFVGIGLISYSAYLWHQPIFALLRVELGEDIEQSIMLIAATSSLGLAYLSWKYIEQPFRNGKVSFFNSRKKIFGSTLFMSTAIFLFGLYGYLSKGLPSRFPEQALKLESFARDTNPLRSKCSSKTGDILPPEKACILGQKTNVVGALIGDSHSDALAFSLNQELEKQNIGLKHFWYHACPAIPGLENTLSNNKKCRDFSKNTFNYIINDESIKTIILNIRFTYYYEGHGLNQIIEDSKHRYDSVDNNNNEISRKINFKQNMESYIDNILENGKNVIIIYPLPEHHVNIPEHATKNVISGGDGNISLPEFEYFKRNSKTISMLDEITNKKNVYVVRPHNIYCDTFVNQACVGSLDGSAYYFDDNHLSNYGAQFLAKEISPLIGGPPFD